MDKRFGYSFSPFYEPNIQGNEAKYCAQLADWWQEMQAKTDVAGIQCPLPRSREHHLISEVTPDTFPKDMIPGVWGILLRAMARWRAAAIKISIHVC